MHVSRRLPGASARTLVWIALTTCLVLPLAAIGGEPLACVTAPPGLLAWYPGDRHADDLARFHHGLLQGDTGYVTGAVGGAFTFDGDDDRVVTAATSTEMRAVRNTFSYMFWAFPSATTPPCPESNASNCLGSPQRWLVFPEHGDYNAPAGEVGLGAGLGIAVGSNAVCVGEHAPSLVDCLARVEGLSLDAWTHIAVVVEDTVPRVYIDGVLVHTGVASTKAFVFASWSVLGDGLGLGHYMGELDELMVFDRVLADAEISAAFAAGANGHCRPECPRQRTDDAWQGALVTGVTALRSTHAGGAFGATDASPESDSLLFADNLPEGTVHSIEWETAAPVTLAGFGLFALHDTAVNTDRAFRRITLQARQVGGEFATVYDRAVTVPYDDGELVRCLALRPTLAQQFRAEFTQAAAAGFSGPRIMELDAVGLPDALFADGFEDVAVP